MRKLFQLITRVTHRLSVVLIAGAMTLTFFLLLPLMQQISERPEQDAQVRAAPAVQPPPPEPPEQEPEEPEEEQDKPELKEQQKSLDLSQIELALNPGSGGGGMLSGNFEVDLKKVAGQDGESGLFSMSQLDQRPRVIYQPSPRMTEAVRQQAPGKVSLIFIVNKNGRVEQAKVQNASHPVFEEPALQAVKQWKFEPGKRNGEPVRFRMRVPMTFPETG